MSKLFEIGGSDDFFPMGSMYTNPKESDLFLSLGRHVDVYFPPCKRSRISAPFIFSGDKFQQKKRASMDVLPDECLFEIFRRLHGGLERSACASVSKRWLMLLSNISRDELCSSKTNQHLEASEKASLVKRDDTVDEKSGVSAGNEAISEVEDLEIEGDGYLSRSLEGKKATDIRLAAMAIGTSSRGGLGKLLIRGSNSIRGVTNLGLRAIARCCPSLRVLSLWNVPSIGDEGLSDIANGCHLIEKLDLLQCPGITDKALLAIAKNCPNLTNLTLESCSNIGNKGLQAVGQCCPKLKCISIKDCPLVGDQAIASLLSSTSFVLTKLNLQSLNVTDVSLAVIGHYGMAVTDLVLTSLQNVTEKGFWVMGNGHGLQKLKSFMVTSCQGVTDIGLDAVGKGCPNLKQFCLSKSAFLSDNGLISFAKSAMSLESLQLEECHRITQSGLFGLLLNSGSNLKALALKNCFGIKNFNIGFSVPSQCKSLRSLTISNCPGFGNASLELLGKLSPELQHVDFGGLQGVTDAGFLSLLENCKAGLVKVNLSGCTNLTDKVISAMAELHGWSLEVLNVDGCTQISDASLMAIAENCPLLSDLDVSKCSITDYGIAILARAKQLNLQILSLSGCSFISDKSLPFLAKLGQTLSGLNIKHLHAISSSTVDLLVKHLWRCDILS